MIEENIIRTYLCRTALFVLVLCLFGCTLVSRPLSEPVVGSTKDNVLASMGEPDQIQDFILPDPPYYGPQEGLINLVPAGTLIEEWTYIIGDDILYVWFSGENDVARDNWLILHVAKFPKGAVF